MIDTDDFLMHYGVLGMKWGVRKDEYRQLSKSDQKLYRKKTLKERTASIRKAREENLKLTLDAAQKHKDNVLIKTRRSSSQYPELVTGSEFVNYLMTGEAIDASMTSIMAFPGTPEGREATKFVEKQIEQIWEPTAERYVRKDRDK